MFSNILVDELINAPELVRQLLSGKPELKKGSY